MQVSKEDMIALVKRMYRPYRCDYCFYKYNQTCSSRCTCDVGIELFFSPPLRTLKDFVSNGESYEKTILSHREESEKTNGS